MGSEPSEYSQEMRVFGLSANEGGLKGHDGEYCSYFPIASPLQYFSQTHFNRTNELSDFIAGELVRRV